jgi:hypothetical protein
METLKDIIISMREEGFTRTVDACEVIDARLNTLENRCNEGGATRPCPPPNGAWYWSRHSDAEFDAMQSRAETAEKMYIESGTILEETTNARNAAIARAEMAEAARNKSEVERRAADTDVVRVTNLYRKAVEERDSLSRLYAETARQRDKALECAQTAERQLDDANLAISASALRYTRLMEAARAAVDGAAAIHHTDDIRIVKRELIVALHEAVKQ